MAGSHAEAVCQWSRSRITDEDVSGVKGVLAVVCGHTPVNRPVVLGNVYHIDTGGWLPHMRGYFTLLNLCTLEATPPIPAKLDWEAVT
jgi:serine/threonine protein phosphatase 1